MNDPGFAIVEGVLDWDECDALTNTLTESSSHRGRAGARNLMSNPSVSALANDHRLLRLAADELKVPAVPFRATLFAKSGIANWHVHWHQDTALPVTERIASEEWGPWSMKEGVRFALAPAWALERVVALRVHLDASTIENGPLRVIAGTHTSGLLDRDAILAASDSCMHTPCLVGRGGVMAMRPLLLHSSMKTRDGKSRRVIHIEYATSLDLSMGARLSIA